MVAVVISDQMTIVCIWTIFDASYKIMSKFMMAAQVLV